MSIASLDLRRTRFLSPNIRASRMRVEWSRKFPCAIRFRIAVHRLGKPLADGGTICGAVLAARNERRCGPTSTGLLTLSPSVFASMDDPLCCVLFATSGWTVSQPCRLDHFVPHHQEVATTEVEDDASSRTRDSTTRPCRWSHMFWTSAVGLPEQALSICTTVLLGEARCFQPWRA